MSRSPPGPGAGRCPRASRSWIVPVNGIMERDAPEVLLPEEQLCQSYLAVIHSAKALTPLRIAWLLHYPWGPCSGLGDRFRKSVNCRYPGYPQTVDYAPGRYDPDCGSCGYAGKRCGGLTPAGGLVLLAANTRPYPVKTTATITGLAGDVTRLFGAERYPVNGGLHGSAGAALCATRAYLLDARELPEPAAVRVEMRSRSRPGRFAFCRAGGTGFQ